MSKLYVTDIFKEEHGAKDCDDYERYTTVEIQSNDANLLNKFSQLFRYHDEPMECEYKNRKGNYMIQIALVYEHGEMKEKVEAVKTNVMEFNKLHE